MLFDFELSSHTIKIENFRSKARFRAWRMRDARFDKPSGNFSFKKNAA
jgi:hypothetical protein